MKEQEKNYQWDGEMIRMTQKEVIESVKPMDVIAGLEITENQINQFQQQLDQMKQQSQTISANLLRANKHRDKLMHLKPKCMELQLTELKETLDAIHEECKAKALKSSKETIAKDPMAYTEEQKNQLPYLDYQKNLATHKRIAENIASSLIKVHLYDKPIFENPF